ncbi:JmjC domain-containing protein [Streptomyces sp. NPDC015242]|uniref:JmjC domain-containing protein n=1 Tax=Streptomyces sp. NPDC015242 TaxID=3364951 RepID=UPI0036F9DA8C
MTDLSIAARLGEDFLAQALHRERLYVPRGVWHAVSADQGTRSLHVTCGLQTHTATYLMAWVSEQLLTHED